MTTTKEPGRMTRREHPSRAAAIREAGRFGYIQQGGFRIDGVYTMSAGKGKPLLAIQRETRPRSVVYHLVEAPQDAKPTTEVQENVAA